MGIVSNQFMKPLNQFMKPLNQFMKPLNNGCYSKSKLFFPITKRALFLYRYIFPVRFKFYKITKKKKN